MPAAKKRTAISNELFGLIVGTYISTILLLVRMVLSGKITHLWLFWNLFLAWIPFILSHLMVRNFHPLRRFPIFFALLGFCWLLFLPNAPYIVTDLKHLKIVPGIPFWFDLVLLTSFAINGLYLGLYSISHIQGVISSLYGQKRAWFLIGAILYLTSLGLYLGRILRWNSWDIISNPKGLLADILHLILNPFENLYIHLVILLVTVVLLLFYRVFYFVFFEKPARCQS
jgi:uncharacterized membrane protein